MFGSVFPDPHIPIGSFNSNPGFVSVVGGVIGELYGSVGAPDGSGAVRIQKEAISQRASESNSSITLHRNGCQTVDSGIGILTVLVPIDVGIIVFTRVVTVGSESNADVSSAHQTDSSLNAITLLNI